MTKYLYFPSWKSYTSILHPHHIFGRQLTVKDAAFSHIQLPTKKREKERISWCLSPFFPPPFSPVSYIPCIEGETVTDLDCTSCPVLFPKDPKSFHFKPKEKFNFFSLLFLVNPLLTIPAIPPKKFIWTRLWETISVKKEKDTSKEDDRRKYSR